MPLQLTDLGQAGSLFLMIAASAFVASAALLALAGLHPKLRATAHALWPAYRSEFIIVGACLIPAALGGWVFLSVLLLACWRGQWEMFRLFDQSTFQPLQLCCYAGGVGLLLASVFGLLAPTQLFALALTFGLFAALLRRQAPLLAALLGLIFPVLCLCLIWQLRADYGFGWLILIYAVVEMNDAFAYIGGKLFGRTKILPRISPKKTLEGLFSGLFIGGVTGLLIGLYALDLSLTLALSLSLLGLIMGLLGDVLTSLLKRWRDKKDFPPALLAHGGILDIYDSVLIAAPLLYGAMLILLGSAR